MVATVRETVDDPHQLSGSRAQLAAFAAFRSWRFPLRSGAGTAAHGRPPAPPAPPDGGAA